MLPTSCIYTFFPSLFCIKSARMVKSIGFGETFYCSTIATPVLKTMSALCMKYMPQLSPYYQILQKIV
jgi:hypothetical protein